MGLWVTTPNIQRLVAKLDWKFSDQGMTKIRANPNRVKRFTTGLKLHNIARLFRIWPGGAAAHNDPDAKKWYGFLAWLHTKQNAANTSGVSFVADDIIKFIAAELQPGSHCRAISFVAIEGPDMRVSVSSLPAPTKAVGGIPADPSAYISVILLQTGDSEGGSVNEPPASGEDPPGEDPVPASPTA